MRIGDILSWTRTFHEDDVRAFSLVLVSGDEGRLGRRDPAAIRPIGLRGRRLGEPGQIKAQPRPGVPSGGKRRAVGYWAGAKRTPQGTSTEEETCCRLPRSWIA